MTAPIRVLVCDDQALIRTGFATVIGAQPDIAAVGDCGGPPAGRHPHRRLRRRAARTGGDAAGRRPVCRPAEGTLTDVGLTPRELEVPRPCRTVPLV